MNDEVNVDKQVRDSDNYLGALGIKNMQLSEVVQQETADHGRVPKHL